MSATAVTEEPQGRAQDAGEGGEDGDGGLEWPHVVRSDPEQGVPLGHRLVHEAEFTVLEIADAAVDHVGRRSRSAAHEVAPLDERDVDALKREIAHRRETVDAAADDEDFGVRTRRQRLETRSP